MVSTKIAALFSLMSLRFASLIDTSLVAAEEDAIIGATDGRELTYGADAGDGVRVRVEETEERLPCLVALAR